jgi:hypothetical protein
VIIWVFSTEKSLMPYTVPLRDFWVGPKIAEEVRRSLLNGFGFEVESEARYQRGNLFDCIRSVFLLNRAELCALDEFAEEMAVVLMDNPSSPITSDMIGLLTEPGARVITFALHTSQTFQVFEMTLFGVLKVHPKYELPFGDQQVTVKFLMKVQSVTKGGKVVNRR